MTNEYIHVTGQDGESYEVRPTDGLLSFLQRMAAEETEKQEASQYEQNFRSAEVICY